LGKERGERHGSVWAKGEKEELRARAAPKKKKSRRSPWKAKGKGEILGRNFRRDKKGKKKGKRMSLFYEKKTKKPPSRGEKKTGGQTGTR